MTHSESVSAARRRTVSDSRSLPALPGSRSPRLCATSRASSHRHAFCQPLAQFLLCTLVSPLHSRTPSLSPLARRMSQPLSPFLLALPSPVSLTPLPTREWAQAILLHHKTLAGCTFADLARCVGAGEVWLTSAVLQQQQLSAEDADKLLASLDVPPELAVPLSYILQQPVSTRSHTSLAHPAKHTRGALTG